MAGPATTRKDAQRRVDRIQAFREELAELEHDHVLILPSEDRARVVAHQDAIVARFAHEYDVDVQAGQRQLSVGMRLASAFGARAGCASVFLFFQHVWGDLSTPVQVIVLIAAPMLSLALMALASRLERTRYITGVFGVIAVASFVLNLSALGDIFNFVPTVNAFLAWGGFALALGYGFRLRWLVAIGLLSLTTWVAGSLLMWTGLSWLSSLLNRAELFFLPATALLIGSQVHRDDDMAATWRLVGAFVLFGALFVLSVGADSYLPWTGKTTRWFYEIAGMGVTITAIAIGVRRRWTEVVNLAALFFTAFLITRMVDWFWDWMPNYLFFLIIGLLALGLIVVFRRLRRGMEVA
jgi:uncharacterized membrane protein